MNRTSAYALVILIGLYTASCAKKNKSTEAPSPATDTTNTTETSTATDTGTATDMGTSEETTPGTDATKPPVNVGLSTQSLVHNQVTREYLVYVPASYDGSTAVPLMLNFHGFGGYMQQHMQTADMRSLADAEQFLLVYPQGTLLDGFPHWNTAPPGGDNKSSADDLGFMDALLASLTNTYNIDANRVYATGYSNGADFTYTLACYRSDKITGIAPVSGLMDSEPETYCTPSHPTSVIIMHGTADFDRPYDGYPGYLLSIPATIAYWNAQNNISGEATTTTFTNGGNAIERLQYTGGTGGAALTHYKVIGGGHIWFNFSDEGVSANRLIWNFLSQFNRDGSRG